MMPKEAPKTDSYLAFVAVLLILVLITAPILIFWGPSLGTFFASFFKITFLFLVGLSGVVGGVIWYKITTALNEDNMDKPKKERKPNKTRAFSVLLVMVSVVFLVFWFFTAGAYRQLQFEKNVVVTEETMPTFEQRAPFSQARILLNRNKGGVQTGVNVANPTFLGGGKWSIIIDGGGTGLKANGVVEWDGQGEANTNFTRCQFDGGTSALTGFLWNNLVREIRFKHGVGAYDLNPVDAYGFCENQKAVMVVPLTRYIGLIPTKRVFAGVAIVRSSKDIQIVKDVEAGTFPGPVYPESLVMEVEAANAAESGSLGDIYFVRNNVLVVDGEDGSPNSRNSGQFMLTGEDGNLYAVSPMNRAKGSGREIVAVAVTPVSYASAGKVNTVTIHMLKSPRQSNSEVGNLVKSEFSSLNWFADLIVMEITPVGPDEWVGSIGRAVSPEHRFTVTADRVICVTDVSTGRSRGCSNDQIPSSEPGFEGDVFVPSSDDELVGLNTQDLINLRDSINNELDSRIPTPQP